MNAQTVRRRLLLDAGALRDAERQPRGRVWAVCRRELAEGRRPLLPVTVLAQMWRGGPKQAGMANLIKSCELVGIDETLARRIGVLVGESGTSDIVDAMVVLCAIDAGAAVVTSDPGDITALAEAAQAKLRIIAI